MSAPRVTIALATRNRAGYLREAIESCLAQTFSDFELLICDNASSDETPEVVASFDDARIRYVRNETDLGMVGNWNLCLAEARGELIANLPDDDLMLPDRLARQVALFDAHPDTGVVFGDAEMIDPDGRATGGWAGRDLDEHELMQVLVRAHNVIPYPSTTIHRRVFEQLGGYSEGYRIAVDLDLWLRVSPHFRFRHTPGGPVVRFRRHDGSGSHESQRALEVAEVERCLESAIEREGAHALAGEAPDERAALALLGDAMLSRGLPLPELGARLAERAAQGRRRIMLTSFGYNDSGGGTIVPRLLSKELVRRGWDVTVFHAALGAVEPRDQPNQVRTWHEDGVRLIGVFNRPSPFMELGNPRREIDDPAISRAFGEALERHAPEVVHFHNLHNLGAGLIDETAERGIPSLFSTHNYWLACPRLYLYDSQLELCHGPADAGGGCAACIGSGDVAGHRDRLGEIRSRFGRGVGVCLAVSEAMRHTLVTAGYPEQMIDVVHQAMPHDQAVWEQLGRDRVPGRVGERLVVGFFGSAYPHKGPSLLVEAAQQTAAEIDVRIYGEVPEQFAQQLQALDRRGVVTLRGAFSHEKLPELLSEVDVAVIPSLWWDCAPLMVSECLAGRVPVLAARMGGISDFVQDEVTGLLFDGRDRDDLTDRLQRLATEPGLVERLQAGIDRPGSFDGYVDTLERYYAGERPNRRLERRAPISVRWRGDQGLPTSLSTINTAVCDRLDDEPGITVQRVPRSGKALGAALPLPAEVEVRHQWPPDFSRSASRLAVIQPWEFGSIPKEWVEPIESHVDEVWVPSQAVRRMYLDAGIAPERIVVVPNGVDLELFRPDGPAMELDAPGTRFLFVGGLIHRKGADLLVSTYLSTFAGRDDVCLVIKDFGADTIYPGFDRSALRRHAAEGLLPRVQYVDDELSPEQLASLYRACDVMVLPYRGEGFCMPALEAMAAGLPVITSAGGPTDEFVPDAACWRIPTSVRHFESNRIDHMETAGTPFELAPDADALARIMREAAQDAEGRRRRGAVGHAAAQSFGWDAITLAYADRLRAVAARAPRHAAADPAAAGLEGEFAARLLATPAWLGNDRLGELLAAWVEQTNPGQSACLYLLADPRLAGDEARCTTHVLEAAAAAGTDLDRGADITIVMQPLRGDMAQRIHAAATGYASLHPACAGHERMASLAGNAVLKPTGGELSSWLAGHSLRSAA